MPERGTLAFHTRQTKVGGQWTTTCPRQPRNRRVHPARRRIVDHNDVGVWMVDNGAESPARRDARTAIGFTHRARAFLARMMIRHVYRIIIDNGASYRAHDFAYLLRGAPPPADHGRTRPGTTGKSSATTGSCPRNSSTPVSGPAKGSDRQLCTCGMSITTIIGATLPRETSRPSPGSMLAPPTS